MFLIKKTLIVLYFIPFYILSNNDYVDGNEYNSNDKGFIYETLNIKEYALLHCLRKNYKATGLYKGREDRNFFNDISTINREYYMDNVLKVFFFTEEETAKYHEVKLDLKNGGEANMVFSLCVDFSKSKKLDDFVKNLKD